MRDELTLDVDVIKENINEIKDDIKKHSKNPENVKLVAVTKYFDVEGVESVVKSGHLIVGENRGQQVRDKERYFRERVSENSDFENIKWHFIGNLQKNKIKYIIDYVELIHSVNNLELAQELDKKAKEKGRVIKGLIEINLSGESSKEGYDKELLDREIEEYKKFENLKIVGLMTMGPNTEDEPLIRESFKKLKTIQDEYNELYFHGELKELSMGMSGDYKIALEEGSTIIRVGTKVFEKKKN